MKLPITTNEQRRIGTFRTFVIKSIFPAILVLFSQPLGAEDFYLDWQMRLLNYDPIYRQAYETHQQEEATARLAETLWWPQASVDPVYSVTKVTTEDGPDYVQKLSLGISFSQKLPWGGAVNGTFSQSVSQTIEVEKTYGYTASGNLGLSMPIQLWDQGFGSFPLSSWYQGYSAGGRALLSRWRSQTLRRTAETLKTFLGGLIDQKGQYNQKLLLEWYKLNSETDQALWEAGKISSFQRSENASKANAVNQSWLQGDKSLVSTKSQLKLWNLDPEIEDLEQWFVKWEMAGPADASAQVWDLQAQKDSLIQSQSSQWQEELSSLPQVSLNYSFTPALGTSLKADTADSLESYWKGSLPWNWTLSTSVHWPLVPWDPVYHVSEMGQNRRD